MLRLIANLGISASLAWALALPTVAAPRGSGEAPPAVSISQSRTVQATEGVGVAREFVISVSAAAGSEPRKLFFRGPGELIDPGEQPRAEVVGERLVVYTRSVIALFDLASGDEIVDRVAAPGVAASADGRWLAFKVLQLPFTPPEATSSVVEVLDVSTAQVEPVFPQRSLIEPTQFGRLLAWIDTPSERHSAGDLVFSPDGTRLAFFCTHQGEAETPAAVYLVVIDLSRGLAAARFTHQPFDWEAFLRPGVETAGRKLYFAVESLRWTEGDILSVTTPPYARWLERELAVPLPPSAPPGAREGGP